MHCGLLGEKLSHSYSPSIHRLFADYNYSLFEKTAEELPAFLGGHSFHGLNVTIPYKKTVISYCQHLTDEARLLGAVNTIVRQSDGTLLGHNTDYSGFRAMALRTGMNYSGHKVLVLGSGGASNTVCAVMKELGANVVVISRKGINNYDNLYLHVDCTVLINATPVGMYPNTNHTPINLDIFPKLQCVMDLIYNPGKTRLLFDAQSRGLITENGLWMLVAQAKESAEWFSNSRIDSSMLARVYHTIQKKMENIILVGMPGCGKSTIGQALAHLTGKTFIDTDVLIKERTGQSSAEIITEKGEKAFRIIESQILSETGKCSDSVIATGGGCVTQQENKFYLQQNGPVVWIQRPLSQLATNDRPLSLSDGLENLYHQRKAAYEFFADFVVQNHASADIVASNILNSIGWDISI